MNKKIAVILPRIEGFSESNFGAVALCVKDNYLFSRYKDNITVFGGKTKESDSYQGINYRYIKTNRLKHLTFSKNKAFAKELLSVLQGEKFDLIEVNNKEKVAEFLAKNLATPIAQHLHNDINDDTGGNDNLSFRKNVLLYSRHIYCVSSYIKERLVQNLPELESKASVVYNGLDPEFFTKFNQQEKANIIIFVGRVTKEKGALETLHAVNQLFEDLTGWNAVFIGSFSKKYHDYVAEFNSALTKHPDRVRHFTHMEFDKVMEQVGKSKIAVLPSQWEEPFGRTILEAILCKSAIVTCKSGGIPEICGKHALYADKQDIASLVANIKSFVLDNSLIKQVISEAYEESIKKFNIRVTTKKLDDIRANILENHKINAG